MSYPQTSFNLTAFTPGSFLGRRRQAVASVTLSYQLKVLKETGRYDAFRLQWNPIYDEAPNVWPVPNHLFWDSDIAKWIEGACYFLEDTEDPEIDFAIKELVDMIRGAQQPDGYLNIHFTVVQPGQRFTNLRDLHELYNAGHLIEAALAHNRKYQNDLLLRPIMDYVHLLCRTFGPAKTQNHGYPGHPEIELALIRLFERTKDSKVLNLARYFIFERGNPHGVDGRHYYDVEAEQRGDRANETPCYFPEKRSYWYCFAAIYLDDVRVDKTRYQQAHKPILEQESIEGHSVRAMYLLTALADLVRIDGNSDSTVTVDALNRLWNSMVDKKMSVTGGIGAMKQWEGFGIDYFLPQGSDEGGCYNETCAAIGVIMLAERLLQTNLDSRYADVMELSLYNATLTGMSLDGTQFTYVNQLASSDKDLSKREKWFTCSCCPPNVSRLLGYLGGCLWSSNFSEDSNIVSLDVHLYNSATIELPTNNGAVTLCQVTDWPIDGTVNFSLEASPSINVFIRLRIPSWASTWELYPPLPDATFEKGYLILSSQWLKINPVFRLTIPFHTRIITPHPHVNQDVVSVARGPLIYCLEDVDNPWVRDHFKSLRFDTSSMITEEKVIDTLTKEPYMAITAHNAAYFLDVEETNRAGQMPGRPITGRNLKRGDVSSLNFIPYYFRANRGGGGQMRVGLKIAHHQDMPLTEDRHAVYVDMESGERAHKL